jgi:hypothetical protein
MSPTFSSDIIQMRAELEKQIPERTTSISRQMLWFPTSKYIVGNKPLGIAYIYYETDDNGVPRIIKNEDYEDILKTLFWANLYSIDGAICYVNLD